MNTESVEQAVRSFERVLSNRLFNQTFDGTTPPMTKEGWDILAVAYVQLRKDIGLGFEGTQYQDGAYELHKRGSKV